MVKLGRVALDGTKLRANASRRKAMSYARMSEKEKILAAEVSDLLAEAEAIDRDEDAKFGKNRRGDELPEQLRRREDRLATIRQAKADLEAEAAEQADERSLARSTERGEDSDTTEAKAQAAADKAVPRPKAQRNSEFHQGWNPVRSRRSSRRASVGGQVLLARWPGSLWRGAVVGSYWARPGQERCRCGVASALNESGTTGLR